MTGQSQLKGGRGDQAVGVRCSYRASRDLHERGVSSSHWFPSPFLRLPPSNRCLLSAVPAFGLIPLAVFNRVILDKNHPPPLVHDGIPPLSLGV